MRTVELNVGGWRYTLPLSTLATPNEPHSYFQGLFERMSLDEDGGYTSDSTSRSQSAMSEANSGMDDCIFIDADGSTFQYIVDYLRHRGNMPSQETR